MVAWHKFSFKTNQSFVSEACSQPLTDCSIQSMKIEGLKGTRGNHAIVQQYSRKGLRFSEKEKARLVRSKAS